MYILLGLVERPRSIYWRGSSSLFSWKCFLEELSVFIDESGDFGDYSYHSPYYIITMVFHRQDVDIQEIIRSIDGNTNVSTSKRSISKIL